jgi:hypothetical protein
MNRWWVQQPDEIYWMEITDREDLGADLNAPQRDDADREYWGYSLIAEIGRGDVVFHYHKPVQAIVATSRVSEPARSDTVIWGARGATARSRGVEPYPRPGWRVGLSDFSQLDRPISRRNLIAMEDQLRSLKAEVEGQQGSPIYFPFGFSRHRPLRAQQAYIAKVPKGLIRLFPQLEDRVL